uniref:Uncharacterized protein n=1 Tax=Lepeophtheirus salmonis TaxID=72036 RepID=A0A0K2TX98_LEPSM
MTHLIIHLYLYREDVIMYQSEVLNVTWKFLQTSSSNIQRIGIFKGLVCKNTRRPQYVSLPFLKCVS